MFERFTSNAKQVVTTAQEEARCLGHNYIGHEHLLLGLVIVEGRSSVVFEHLDIDAEQVRGKFEKTEEKYTGQIPFTPWAKRAMEFSLRDALSLGHNWIDTGHLLLGLIRLDSITKEELVVFQVLEDLGVTKDQLRDMTILVMNDQPREE